MKPWQQRATEVANNLGPSFIAMVVHEVAWGHKDQADSPLPFQLAFLAVPTALHAEARGALPKTTAGLMPKWLQANHEIRARIVDRARAMVGLVREGLLWGSTHSVVAVDATGVQALRKPFVQKYLRGATSEIQQIAERGRFLGKWLAKAGTPATVMVWWGVRL